MYKKETKFVSVQFCKITFAKFSYISFCKIFIYFVSRNFYILRFAKCEIKISRNFAGHPNCIV
jgi:hypothetical protein